MSDNQNNSTQRPANAAALCKQAEEQARNMDPASLSAQTPEEIQPVLQELRAHQIELELQNEKLRRAQEEIDAAHARYFDLYDLAPVGYCTLSKHGLFLEANLTLAMMLGLDRDALLQQALSRFILKEDQDVYDLHREQLLETGELQECELRLVRPDGSRFWAQMKGTVARTEDGSPVCRQVVNDITKRKLTEDELRKFKIISDNAVSGKAIADLQGNLQYVNRFFANIHGYEPEEVLGKHLSVFHSREQMDAADRFVATMKREDSFRSTTVWHRHKNGTVFPMMMSGILIKDDCGNPQCIAASAIDMTAHQQAEERLRQDTARRRVQAELVAQIASSAHLAEGAVHKLAAELTEAVSSALEIERMGVWLFNKDQSELVCVDTYEASQKVHTSGAVLARCEFKNEFDALDNAQYVDAHDALTDPRTAGYVEHYLKPNNITSMLDAAIRIEGRNLGTLCLEHVGKPHRWRDDEIAVACQLADQVAFAILHLERKRADEVLREREALLQQSQQIGHIGSWKLDLMANRLTWSDEVYRIFGCEPQEFAANYDSFLDLVHPDDRAAVDEAYSRSVREGSDGYEIEHRVVRRNSGDVRYVHERCVNVRDEAGAIIQSTGMLQDITKRKQVEAERERLRAQLSQAQKMESVGRLAGGVAHDFNNMLNVILGRSEMALERLPVDSVVRADLEEIEKAAERSAELTRQLLAFARKQTVAPRVFDLNDAVGSLLKMLERLVGEDIALSFAPHRRPLTVQMDPSQLDQILANLCVNARDAIGDTGKVIIETSEVDINEAYCEDNAEAQPGLYARLVVSDTGCGMSQETLSHLFEPFFTTKPLGKGTGLGLATVYGIVKQNRGFINVYSEPDQGTTFSLHLPRHLALEERRSLTLEPTPEARGHETILVVEDEPMILDLTTTMLTNQGYIVLGAKTPGEALQLAREHAGELHVLLTDVIMPEMNGRFLAKQLLALYPKLRCVFMSGYTADLIAHHGVLDEGVCFLQKPFTRSTLTAKVKEALECVDVSSPRV